MGRNTDVNEEKGVVGSARAARADSWASACGVSRQAVNGTALQRQLLSVLGRGNGVSTAIEHLSPSS